MRDGGFPGDPQSLFQGILTGQELRAMNEFMENRYIPFMESKTSRLTTQVGFPP